MKKIKQLTCVGVYLFTLFFGMNACTPAEETKQPNVVLLFVDDLGWADVGFRNSTFKTPNIDRLKEEGVSFNRAYVSTPTCSPSRASILTGKEPVRFQMVRHITHEDKITGRNESEFNYWKKDPAKMASRNWLPLEEKTYAEALKKQGYYNQFIGKWHAGHEEYHPTEQGFDVQYGTGNHGHPNSYYYPFFKHVSPLADCKEGEYLTDVLTQEAEDFIQRYDKEQPFMLSMWYYAVHGPFVGREDWLKKYLAQGLDEKYAKYAAMVTVMDESVGKIREALVKKGIADNTVIVFTSDQGGAFQNGPLRGGKFGGISLCEGGARVPFIVYYPGLTQANTENNTPIQTIDIYPTLVELASGKSCQDKQINGVSILPLLKGDDIAERNLYFYRSYEDQYAAVINGNWKLIKYRSGKYELYNLKADVSEVDDLVNIKSEIAKKLLFELNNWEKEAVPNLE